MLTIRYQSEPFSGRGHGFMASAGTRRVWRHCIWAPAMRPRSPNSTKASPDPVRWPPYRLDATAIADITDGRGGACDDNVARAMAAPWKSIAEIEGGLPPSWALAAKLIADGAQGALVPSA